MWGSIDFDYGWMVETDLVLGRSIVTDLVLECSAWLSHEVCISELNSRQKPLKSQSASEPYLIPGKKYSRRSRCQQRDRLLLSGMST